jgi:two-component system, cell cycle response regulator
VTSRILYLGEKSGNGEVIAMLEHAYFDVTVARESDELFQALRRDGPDLLVIDGAEEARALAVLHGLANDGAHRHTPCLLLCDTAQTELRTRALALGVDDILMRSANEAEIFSRIRSLNRLRMAREELRNREATEMLLGQSHLGRRDPVLADARILVASDTVVVCEQLAQLAPEWPMPQDVRSADIESRASGALCDLIVVNLDATTFDPLRVIADLRSSRTTRHLPLLALTSEPHAAIARRAIDLGTDDLLALPMDSVETVTRTRTLIRRKRLADRLRDNLHLSIRLATTDPLTGLFNRHYVLCHLSTLMQRASQTRRPLSVALIDVDHFKSVNDTWGHSAGDTVLRHVGERLALNVRGVDLAGRYGGEEFIVVMPDTDMPTAQNIAGRLCQVIAEHKFPCRSAEDILPISLTVSIGLSTLSPDDDTAGRQIIDRADQALYDAKRSGRNCVKININHADAVS